MPDFILFTKHPLVSKKAIGLVSELFVYMSLFLSEKAKTVQTE